MKYRLGDLIEGSSQFDNNYFLGALSVLASSAESRCLETLFTTSEESMEKFGLFVKQAAPRAGRELRLSK